MENQSIYKLKGKSPIEVKQAFIHYMGDKNKPNGQFHT